LNNDSYSWKSHLSSVISHFLWKIQRFTILYLYYK
jgi:hypothetical protein